VSTVTYTGILLALVATTAYNVGLILEKRALGQMPALNLRRVLRVIGSLMTSRAWLAGFALMLTGLACQTIALTFEPVSVVQPVLASGVVLVLVLSRLVLRERLHGGETWAWCSRPARCALAGGAPRWPGYGLASAPGCSTEWQRSPSRRSPASWSATRRWRTS
jgi:hypothetical protein